MNSLKWINSVAFLAMVTVNVLANAIPIGGNMTGEVSQSYPNLFTPAPITFAIWGVIYLLLMLFILFQLGIMGNSSTAAVVRDVIGWSFVASCVLNIGWILAWHMRLIGLSAVFIVLLLVNLILITMKLYVSPTSFFNFLMVKLGFDIYYGWIIAATIANFSVLLVKVKWNRFGLTEVTWTLIILIVGALIASSVVFLNGRHFAGLAVIWAYVGIIIKHASSSGFGGQYKSIIVAAVIGIFLIGCASVFRLICPVPKVGINSTYE